MHIAQRKKYLPKHLVDSLFNFVHCIKQTNPNAYCNEVGFVPTFNVFTHNFPFVHQKCRPVKRYSAIVKKQLHANKRPILHKKMWKMFVSFLLLHRLTKITLFEITQHLIKRNGPNRTTSFSHFLLCDPFVVWYNRRLLSHHRIVFGAFSKKWTIQFGMITTNEVLLTALISTFVRFGADMHFWTVQRACCRHWMKCKR